MILWDEYIAANGKDGDGAVSTRIGDERQFVLRTFGFFRSSSVLRGDIAIVGLSRSLGTTFR